MEGDALSTTAFVLGPEEGMALIESLPDTEAVLLRRITSCITAAASVGSSLHRTLISLFRNEINELKACHQHQKAGQPFPSSQRARNTYCHRAAMEAENTKISGSRNLAMALSKRPGGAVTPMTWPLPYRNRNFRRMQLRDRFHDRVIHSHPEAAYRKR